MASAGSFMLTLLGIITLVMIVTLQLSIQMAKADEKTPLMVNGRTYTLVVMIAAVIATVLGSLWFMASGSGYF